MCIPKQLSQHNLSSTAAIFFIVGTFLFLVCTLIDFKSTCGNGAIAMINSSLYIFGAAALLAGSIAFLPGLMDEVTCFDYTPCPLGQYLYIGGTLGVCFALLWVSSYYVDGFKSDNILPDDHLTANSIEYAIRLFLGHWSFTPQWQRYSPPLHYCAVLCPRGCHQF